MVESHSTCPLIDGVKHMPLATLRQRDSKKSSSSEIRVTRFLAFGDLPRSSLRTFLGGNDCEIFSGPRTIGHSVISPVDMILLSQ